MDSVIATGEVINQFDFIYDAVGNITEERTSSEIEPEMHLEMTYQAANQLATVDGQAVQFDADGNMLSGPLAGNWTNFWFDSRNRLTQAGNASYRYDAENQRIGVNQTQLVVNSQPALSQVLVKETFGQQTFYVYGLGLIGEETDGQYRSYHFDYRGSTVALTDEAAQVTQRFQYAPYGELISGDVSITSFLFNGMYGVMTDDNGLYYMRARFYNPEIKRFVNQDVLLGSVVEGRTLNRFAYVTGDPIKYTDPYGLERRMCNGGERAVFTTSKKNVYLCVKDDREPLKVCAADPDDKYGCYLRRPDQGGNDDGPRPYVGIGGHADEHFLVLGISIEKVIIFDGRRYCCFKSGCGSIGPGFFFGGGVTVPVGISMDNIEESLAGKSMGLSLNIGTCQRSTGASINFGYNEDGITSIGSAKGAGRLGFGCGLSLAVDICETEVLWCEDINK